MCLQVSRNESILRYYDHWVDDTNRLHIVTDFAAGGDLVTHVHHIQREGVWNTAVALQLMIDMAEGLKYVHSKGVWHRDIKPANISLSTRRATRCWLTLGWPSRPQHPCW